MRKYSQYLIYHRSPYLPVPIPDQVWNTIPNSHMLRISVRVSDSANNWSEGSAALPSVAGSYPQQQDVHYFPLPLAETGSSQHEHEEMTMYVIIMGKTNYGARGMTAHHTEESVYCLARCDDSLRRVMSLQFYESHMNSQADLQNIHDWNLPTEKEPDGSQCFPLIYHAFMSAGPSYDPDRGTPAGKSHSAEAFGGLPDAPHLRWQDAAMRAIVRLCGLPGLLHLDRNWVCRFPKNTMELRLPSWHLDGSPSSPSQRPQVSGSTTPTSSSSSSSDHSCYAYVRVTIDQCNAQRMPGPGKFPCRTLRHPGGHCCYLCGSLPYHIGYIGPKYESALMKCSQCGEIKYCSKSCQKVDWKRHRSECERR
jgi:hypothetical protein